MKAILSILVSFLLCRSAVFAATPAASNGAPTADDIREQLLPRLVRKEISIIHLAGLDCEARPQIFDLDVCYMEHWSELNVYSLSFRTFWKATEDVYTKQFLSGIPKGEVWLLRCGRAGHSYPVSWDDLFVERETVPDEDGNPKTVFDLMQSSLFTIKWDAGEHGWPFGTKSCWEARAAFTGETMRFFDSPSEIPEPGKSPPPVRNPAPVASAPPSTEAPSPVSAALEGAVEEYRTIDDFISVPKNVYDAIAPFLGTGVADRAKKIASTDARWANKFWVPRKFKTILGSVESVMDIWNKFGMAEKSGEVGGLVFLGLRDGKSPSEIADLIADTKTLVPDDFGTEGELGFYLGRIVAGVVSGQSFSTIAEDIVDLEKPDRLGFWGKAGAGLGFLVADAVIGIEKFLNRGERDRFEQRMIDGIRRKGYGEEAEKAFRGWLALDDSIRARTPFKLKDEWRGSSAGSVASFVERIVEIEKRHRPAWCEGRGLQSRLPQLRAALADYRALERTGVPDALLEEYRGLVQALDAFIRVLSTNASDENAFVDAVSAVMTHQLLIIRSTRKAGVDHSRLASVWPEAATIQNDDDPSLYAPESGAVPAASASSERLASVASVVDRIVEIERLHTPKIEEFSRNGASDKRPIAEQFRDLARLMDACCRGYEELAASLPPSLDDSFRRSFLDVSAKNRALADLFSDLAAAAAAAGGPDIQRLKSIQDRMESAERESRMAEAEFLRAVERIDADTSALRAWWPGASELAK